MSHSSPGGSAWMATEEGLRRSVWGAGTETKPGASPQIPGDSLPFHPRAGLRAVSLHRGGDGFWPGLLPPRATE